MSKTRIYEVARNLDRTSKEILAISYTLGFEAKAANSSLDQAQISAIENYLIPPEPKKKKSRKKVNQFENVSDELVSESSGQRQSENYGGMTKKEVKRYQKAQRKLEKQSKTRQKVDKKAVKLPKQYSQRKANMIVYGTVIGLVALSAFALFSTGLRNFKQANPQSVTALKADSGLDTNNKINLFLSNFVGAYFNKGLDNSNQDALISFYGGELLDVKNPQTNKGAYELVSSTLLEIKDKVGSYAVTYRVRQVKEIVGMKCQLFLISLLVKNLENTMSVTCPL